MILDELKIRLGFEADTFKVKDFVHSIGEIPTSVAAAITSLAGVGLGFIDLTRNALDMSNSLGVFRAETGLSTNELQRWQAVAKGVGLSGDVVSQSVMGIANALAQIRLGHGADAMLAFGRLGVNFRGKSPFEILSELGANNRGLDPNMRRTLMGSLGVSPEMLRIFSLPQSQFKRMASMAPIMTEDEMASMQDLQQELARFGMQVEKSFIPALQKIEPYLGDLAKALTMFVEMFGETAAYWLEKMNHGRVMKSLNDNFMEGRGSYNVVGRTMIYQGGDMTYNITGLTNAELVARDQVEQHFRREMTRAAKHLDNGGY